MPHKNMTNWFSFSLTLPTTAKRRFGFALVLAYAPTLVVTHSKKLFFFQTRIDSRGSGPHHRQFLRWPECAWVETADESQHFPSQCQLSTGELMMKLGTFCSLSLPVSLYSTRSNSDVRSPPANSYRRHVLQPIRKITSRIRFYYYCYFFGSTEHFVVDLNFYEFISSNSGAFETILA